MSACGHTSIQPWPGVLLLKDLHLIGLIDSNLHTLDNAAELLRTLSAEDYRHIHQPYFESSIGKHLRHILDHYLCFQRDFHSGLVDYDQRLRDVKLETDKDYALTVIAKIVQFLSTLQQQTGQDHPLKVQLCNDVELPAGSITLSSLGRELQFLQGHSVHHFALIAAILRLDGHSVSSDFGVAPSTLVHEKTVKETA